MSVTVLRGRVGDARRRKDRILEDLRHKKTVVLAICKKRPFIE